jgi:hypothetical protein
MAFGGVKGALAALGGSAALDAAFKPSLVANIGAAHAARLDKRDLGTQQASVERHTERRILAASMWRGSGPDPRF